jgi:hypothetical protein
MDRFSSQMATAGVLRDSHGQERQKRLKGIHSSSASLFIYNIQLEAAEVLIAY